ncbi:MAG: hypothetical protein JW936_02890 [Sedimentisphaerales bacterium]|nr:hypothetical protein [Sedimentisphaerales bacterium]
MTERATTSLNFDPKNERIRLAHARLAAAYRRENDGVVPVVEPGVGRQPFSSKECYEDLENMLANAVGWANGLAGTDNDWPAVIANYCTVVMVAEAFGCEVEFVGNAPPWARHLVGDIGQVFDLKPRKLEEVPTIKRQFEWVDFAQRKLGSELPMWTLDIQSPFSVAAQIVEPTELMMGCVTNPKAVHHICRMVTDYTLEFMTKHLEQMEHPGYPGANFPTISENIGLCLADDTPLVMLSPAMYEEFALPYNSELGEAFGGIHLHSCGDYRHNLDNVLKIKNIRSIQLHAGPGEFELPESADEDCAFNRARKQVAIFVDTNDVARGDKYKGKCREHYAEYVLPSLCGGDMRGCILQSCGCVGRADDSTAQEALKWTREQLV